MSIFVKATAAPTPKTDASKKISLLYAGILTVFALAQLYTFEEFIELIPAFNLPFGELFSYALAPLIVVFEILAIPFLLRMKLSPAFRFFSMTAGCLVALVWLFISTWLVLAENSVAHVGFIGTVLNLNPGWWAVLISLSLVILATWASWGLWPLKRR